MFPWSNRITPTTPKKNEHGIVSYNGKTYKKIEDDKKYNVSENNSIYNTNKTYIEEDDNKLTFLGKYLYFKVNEGGNANIVFENKSYGMNQDMHEFDRKTFYEEETNPSGGKRRKTNKRKSNKNKKNRQNKRKTSKRGGRK